MPRVFRFPLFQWRWICIFQLVVFLGWGTIGTSSSVLSRFLDRRQKGRQRFRDCWDVLKGVDLTGRVFLVTGCYRGLGAATTRALLSANAKVIMTGRNEQRLQDFCAQLVAEHQFDPTLIDARQAMDLGDLASVQNFARFVQKNHAKIDGLILNAGVMATPTGTTTRQGLEMQMGINCVGHFLLAKMLAPMTRRQVWVSSRAHSWYKARPVPLFNKRRAPRINLKAIFDHSYNGWMRYQQSKLGNILLAKAFAARYPHLETASVSPGMVATHIYRHGAVVALFGMISHILPGFQTPEQGCKTQVYCAITPSLETGGYYHACQVTRPAEAAKIKQDAQDFFDFCNEQTRHFQ